MLRRGSVNFPAEISYVELSVSAQKRMESEQSSTGGGEKLAPVTRRKLQRFDISHVYRSRTPVTKLRLADLLGDKELFLLHFVLRPHRDDKSEPASCFAEDGVRSCQVREIHQGGFIDPGGCPICPRE